MHSRPAQMDGGDRGRTGGQISQRRAAGQSHLVNPNHLPPLLGHIGIDQRNSPQHDPLAAHQTGPLHSGHQRWEFLSQPGLRATAHLFPHPVATEKSGRQNAHDRTGHCPAHDRPKRSGKRVHRWNSPDGTLRAAETSIRSGRRCGGQARDSTPRASREQDSSHRQKTAGNPLFSQDPRPCYSGLLVSCLQGAESA